MKEYLEFILFHFFKLLVFTLPKGFMKKILDFLAKNFYKFDKKHTNIARVNLDLIFKDKLTTEKKEDIVLKSWQNLFYNIYEFIKNSTLTKEQINNKITIKNEYILKELVEQDKNIIIITAHIGNWEIIPLFVGINYKKMVVVGRKVNNKLLNRYLIEYRSKFNSSMLTKESSAKGLIKAIKDKNIVGLVIDQHIDVKKAQIVNFTGLKAPLVDSSARLAKKLNCVILPIFSKRVSWDRYELIIENPITITKEDDLVSISQKQADILSNWIYQYPEQWFLQHKRFKEFYNDEYKKISNEQ